MARDCEVEFTFSDGAVHPHESPIHLNEVYERSDGKIVDPLVDELGRQEFLKKYLDGYEEGKALEAQGHGGLINMTEEQKLEDYESKLRDPLSWVEKAQNSLVAARILREAYDNAIKKIQTTVGTSKMPLECGVLESAIFLYATATEVYLKSIIVAEFNWENDPEFLSNKGHALHWLAEQAGLDLNAEERRLLRRLEEFIRTWGRYPVMSQKYSGDWRKQVVFPNGAKVLGIQPLWYWGPSDFAAIESFLSTKVLPKLLPFADKAVGRAEKS